MIKKTNTKRHSKTINNIKELENSLNININKDQKEDLELFFKNRFVVVENKKITYPEKKELIYKNSELNKKINKLKTLYKFWNKELENSQNYYKKIITTKFFKKDYWKHKFKEFLNKEYKEDLENTKITENILMDPEYKHLFNAFLVDADYRKKLSETVKTSIIYKNSNIGDISKKKQEFRMDTSKNKLKTIKENIKNIKKQIKINKIILKLIK